VELTFATKNTKQLEALEYWIDDTTEQILYGGAKAGGKSFLGASAIFGDALIYPGTMFFIARQELNDLVKFTIPTIHQVFQNWGIKLEDYGSYNGQDKAFYLHNGSKVFLIACKEIPSDPLYERFGSMQMTRGWIEEGGEIAEAAKANLWLSIGRWKNDTYNLKKKLLITANPKKGWMKRDFVDPFRAGVLPPSRKFVTALPTDNPYLPADYVETLRTEKDNVRRQRLFEGNWDYDEDQDSLVTYDALTDLFSNSVVKDNHKYMVVDVARKGKDTTVFSYWDGLELYKVEQFQHQTIDVTNQKIRDKASIERIPYSHIIVDEDGIGGGVVDHLHGVKGFVANSSPLPTSTEIRQRFAKITHDLIPRRNFANLKAQCAFKLAEMINEHHIAIRIPEMRDIIIEELTALLRQRDINKETKLAIKKKEDVKEELGRSPDIGDTIIYRMWFELQKEAVLDSPEREKARQKVSQQFVINRGKLVANSSK